MSTSASILLIVFILVLVAVVACEIYTNYKNDGKIDPKEALTIISDLNTSIADLVVEYDKLKKVKSEDELGTEKEFIEAKMLEKIKLTNLTIEKAELVSKNLNMIIDYVLANKDKFIK